MARVLRCDICRRVHDIELGVIVHEHMVKRKSKVTINSSWESLDICETCLIEFRKLINERKQEVK